MNHLKCSEVKFYKTHSECQAKSKKRLHLRQKAYYYNSKVYKENIVSAQRLLKLASNANCLNSILKPLDGIRNRLKLKTLMFLIKASKHGYLRISYNTIARVLNCSDRQAIRNIRCLMDLGFINTISEKHTLENMLSNLYVILDIFQDKNLSSQLNNMYYSLFNEEVKINKQKELKPKKKVKDKKLEFGVIVKRRDIELINYNSISTQNFSSNQVHHRGSTKSIGNILNNLVKSRGAHSCGGLKSACRVGAHRSDSQCYEADSSLRSKIPERKGIEMIVLNDEEKNKIRKFITPDLNPSYLLFKDKNEHPDKYAHKEEEACRKIKPHGNMANYLQQFKDGFVETRVLKE